MNRNDAVSIENCRDAARREFLRACGMSAIALLGSASISPIVRKAFALPPVWSAVPDQLWAIGVPVHLDLADYCVDPDGDPLVFSLDQPLPPGLTLTGSVISGTPSSSFSPRSFTATSDDSSDTTPPAAPVDLRER